MSKSTKPAARIAVNAKRIREAFAAGEFTAPDAALPSLIGGTYTVKGGHVPSASGLVRGRLHPLAVEAFNDQSSTEVYAGEKKGGVNPSAPVATVEVPMFSAKTGRAIKPRVLPVSEVRNLAGTPNKKGRVSKADLAAAAKALGSGEPKAPAKAKAVAPVAK